jgi:hypothetical protein
MFVLTDLSEHGRVTRNKNREARDTIRWHACILVFHGRAPLYIISQTNWQNYGSWFLVDV